MKSSTTSSKMKSFKDIKCGDIVIGDTSGMFPISRANNGYFLAYHVRENEIGFIYGPSGSNTHDTFNIDLKKYEAYKEKVTWASPDTLKINLKPVQDQLLELPVVERILPKNQRINEKVFNLVEDGEMPSYDDMRLLVLRYHKALETSEKNMELYNKVIFGESGEQPEEISIPDGSIGINDQWMDVTEWKMSMLNTPYMYDSTPKKTASRTLTSKAKITSPFAEPKLNPFQTEDMSKYFAKEVAPMPSEYDADMTAAVDPYLSEEE